MTTRILREHMVNVPEGDCDVILNLPSGKQVVVQLRPSNADTNYNGSLDIILPEDTLVACYIGDDLEPAPEAQLMRGRKHERRAKQLVMELP
jgi:hypothetical protein